MLAKMRINLSHYQSSVEEVKKANVKSECPASVLKQTHVLTLKGVVNSPKQSILNSTQCYPGQRVGTALRSDEWVLEIRVLQVERTHEAAPLMNNSMRNCLHVEVGLMKKKTSLRI